MLGPFFRIGEQFLAEALILGGGRASLPRSGNRANLDCSTLEAHMDLRRTADQSKFFTQPKAEHVRRGVDESQRAIQSKRVAVKCGFEPLRRNHLKDVACL